MRLLPLYLSFLCLTSLHARDGVGLSDSVQAYVDRSELAGAVMMVADKNEILTTETVGWANIESGKEMTEDSMFWIASQSKPITAAAFMMLVDEGKVSLDDSVEKYLPEFADQMLVSVKTDDQTVLTKPSHPITVREVLSHTSGLPFSSAMEKPTLDLYALEARVRSYAMTPLEYEPSTGYRYSNAGINTAARILEVVSGISYEDFLQERLFGPLGMVDTTFWPTEEQVKRIATSYKAGPEMKGLEPTEIVQLHYPLSDRVKRFPMPAGGLFSTTKDVSLFYRMLLNAGEWKGKRYLSENAIEELTRKQTPDEVKNEYGLGFKVTENSFGHAGAYGTNTTAHVDKGIITIWLVQHAAFPGNGKEAQNAFRTAAMKKYAGAKK